MSALAPGVAASGRKRLRPSGEGPASRRTRRRLSVEVAGQSDTQEPAFAIRPACQVLWVWSLDCRVGRPRNRANRTSRAGRPRCHDIRPKAGGRGALAGDGCGRRDRRRPEGARRGFGIDVILPPGRSCLECAPWQLARAQAARRQGHRCYRGRPGSCLQQASFQSPPAARHSTGPESPRP